MVQENHTYLFKGSMSCDPITGTDIERIDELWLCVKILHSKDGRKYAKFSTPIGYITLPYRLAETLEEVKA